MSSDSIIVACAACCAVAAVAFLVLKRKGGVQGRIESKNDVRLGRSTDRPAGGDTLTENDHVFSGFIKQHEKRILAFLIEEEAGRLSLERDAILALRSKYGTELVRPAYDAQEQLGKCGINPMAVTRLQKEWIKRNGGNPNAHPSSREVERILIERNKDKASAVCAGKND